MATAATVQATEVWTTGYKALGIIACIGGLIIHLVIGSMHQWGIITIYVTSYFKTFDNSVTLQSNAITFPLIQLCYGFTMRLGIYLAEITHPLFILITATFCFSACIFASSYVTSIGAFLVLFSILWGLFIGLVFMIPVVECNKYLPGMKMYVNGCIFAGTGLSSVVFSTFSYSYINPNKLKPIGGYYLGTPELQTIAMTVPSLLRYLSLFFFLMSLGSIAMMAPVILHNRRKENEKKELEKAKREENERNGIVVPEEGHLIIPNEANSIKQAMSSGVCWMIVLTILMSGPGMYLMNGNYKTYVKKTIDNDQFLTLIGVLAGIANGISRFFWNILFQKTGYRFVMSIILGTAITVYATIRFTVENEIAYLFEIFFINLCLGGLLVVTPTVIQIIFGTRTGSNIYGFFWCMIATSNWIQYFYVGYVSKSIGFDNVLYICLAMAGVPFFILIFYHYEGPWKNPTKDIGWFQNCSKKDEENKVSNQPNLKSEESMNELNNETLQKRGNHETVKPPKKLPPLNHEGYEIVLRSTASIPEDNAGTKVSLPSTQKTIEGDSNKLIEPNDPK